ncbi:aldehyde dehydrogenase family protein [Salinicoccus sp. Marseille-QA3877]
MTNLIEKKLDDVNDLLKKYDIDGPVPNLIGGSYRSNENIKDLKFAFNDEDVLQYSIGDGKDVKEAIEIADKSLSDMKQLTSYEKSLILDEVASKLDENKLSLASLIVFETGKPINDAIGEVERSISTLKFTSIEVKQIKGETLNLDSLKDSSKRLAFTKVEPLGVIGAITGFNFPLLLGIHKIGPALGAGNTVVLKPSPKTPISSILLGKLFIEAGLPAGALSVINGDEEVGKEIIDSEKIKAISFTGSSKVGKIISGEAKFKKVLLELGSNAATIIDTNKDIKQFAKLLVKGGLSTNGQSCISVQRVIVKEDFKDELIKELQNELENINVGNPFDENVSVSALIDPNANKRILSWIEEAKAQGADINFGGELTDKALQPTLLSNVTKDMKVFFEEIFGPVITVSTYKDFNEAIELTNHSEYGLQVGVHTESLTNALEAIERIEAGSVHVNETSNFRPDHMPYGGVKDSGIGKEGPKYVIDELTSKKVITMKL